MNDQRNFAYAATLLRATLGVMFIAHSVILKYFIYTPPGTAEFCVHG